MDTLIFFDLSFNALRRIIVSGKCNFLNKCTKKGITELNHKMYPVNVWTRLTFASGDIRKEGKQEDSM